jgi:RNA polymerase sigma factor (sigma-70 family)
MGVTGSRNQEQQDDPEDAQAVCREMTGSDGQTCSQLLQQLIEELPEEKRAVFRLVNDAEMETRRVAQTLGIPEGTVKSRLHYANRRLAQKWRDLQQEWEDMA